VLCKGQRAPSGAVRKQQGPEQKMLMQQRSKLQSPAQQQGSGPHSQHGPVWHSQQTCRLPSVARAQRQRCTPERPQSAGSHALLRRRAARAHVEHALVLAAEAGEAAGLVAAQVARVVRFLRVRPRQHGVVVVRRCLPPTDRVARKAGGVVVRPERAPTGAASAASAATLPARGGWRLLLLVLLPAAAARVVRLVVPVAKVVRAGFGLRWLALLALWLSLWSAPAQGRRGWLGVGLGVGRHLPRAGLVELGQRAAGSELGASLLGRRFFALEAVCRQLHSARHARVVKKT
jgi:hypothetical protein